MSENKLYVGNLSFKTTDDQLAQLFAEFGTVGSATEASRKSPRVQFLAESWP
jgi:RNA recognition motif-containing protein